MLIVSRAQEVSGDQKCDQEGEIQWEYPEHTATIKHSKIVRRRTGIEQYPANQESRENEKEVHARPSES
jgi:hypothetical protein